ncbi:MAG: hypothetical protein JXR70_17455 [Spirochaetales bacterium]|nr:hypothetical protein [Spirochaetales bacterium]
MKNQNVILFVEMRKIKLFNYMDIQRIISKYYNPKDKLSEICWRLYKDPRVLEKATWGIVEDIKDPEGYGRVKVRAPLVFANAVTPWIPMLRPWASRKHGIWTLPDIGDAVIIGFILCDPSQPFVMGCIPTKRTLPYLKKNPENNQKYIRTKSGLEIIMNDKDGEEELIVSAKNGKMLFLMDSKGLQITNELGDIKVKARKVSFASKNILLKAAKDCSQRVSDGSLKQKASKALAYKASSNLVFDGKKIKLKGRSGVTAGGKQIAKKDDMVVGVDKHDVQIPTNSGMRTIPMIPHPYIGKLSDKLSTDVTVNDKPAAVKGSKSKNNPSHIPIGGVKFKKNPNNEGEVSSGTEASVKINDKEAAVLGSKVKTCNDPQPQETCSIVAIGASVALPIMPPGFDPEQYKRDGGFKINLREPVAAPGQYNALTDERSLVNPKWSRDKVSSGDEIIMSVDIQSQTGLRGPVHFRIFPEGADPEVDLPIAVKSVSKEEGTAQAKWHFSLDEYKLPERDNAVADFLKEKMDMDIDPEDYKYYIEDYEEPFDNPLTETAKFFFACKAFRCDEVKSEAIEIGDSLNIIFYDEFQNPVKDVEYSILCADGQKIEGVTGDDGKIQEKAVIPGIVQFHYKYPCDKTE